MKPKRHDPPENLKDLPYADLPSFKFFVGKRNLDEPEQVDLAFCMKLEEATFDIGSGRYAEHFLSMIDTEASMCIIRLTEDGAMASEHRYASSEQSDRVDQEGALSKLRIFNKLPKGSKIDVVFEFDMDSRKVRLGFLDGRYGKLFHRMLEMDASVFGFKLFQSGTMSFMAFDNRGKLIPPAPQIAPQVALPVEPPAVKALAPEEAVAETPPPPKNNPAKRVRRRIATAEEFGMRGTREVLGLSKNDIYPAGWGTETFVIEE